VTVPLLDLVVGNLAREEPLEVVGTERNIVRVRDRVQRGGLQIALTIPGDSAQRVIDLQLAAVHLHKRHTDRGIGEFALEAVAHHL